MSRMAWGYKRKASAHSIAERPRLKNPGVTFDFQEWSISGLWQVTPKRQKVPKTLGLCTFDPSRTQLLGVILRGAEVLKNIGFFDENWGVRVLKVADLELTYAKRMVELI